MKCKDCSMWSYCGASGADGESECKHPLFREDKGIEIRTATNFLTKVYSDNHNAVATIVTAEASHDIEKITDALKGVVDFCNDLIEKLNK